MTIGRMAATRHVSDLGRWEMMRAEPDRALRPYVRGYCGYRERTGRPMVRRELPGEDVIVIVNLGEPISVGSPGSTLERRGSFAAGLSRGPSVTRTAGSQHGLQINFTPFGARMFFGLPMEQLTDRALELTDLLASDADSLIDRIADAPTWGSRFTVAEDAIARRFASAVPPPPAVAWAWARLRETEGAVRIDDLARALGASRRHLTGSFRREVGLPPKVAARILRLRRAIRLLEGGANAGLAHVAAVCGYYDQAHLDRDFRDLAGMTPSAFVARRLPDGGGLAER